MPRIHGERIQDFWARQQSELESREAMKRYQAMPRVTVELPVLCHCRARKLPHQHELSETVHMLRQRGLDPAKYINDSPSGS